MPAGPGYAPGPAKSLLRRVRDHAQVRAGGTVDRAVDREALDFLQVDGLGLDQSDRRILLTIIEIFGGGPAGLETLAASTGEAPDAMEDVFEPFLLQLGLLARTPRARVTLEAAYRHLNCLHLAPRQMNLDGEGE